MTPKQKAKDLVNKFSRVGLQQRDEGIECAIICVGEILELDVRWYDQKLVKDYPKNYKPHETFEFWQDVKNELLKLYV